MPIWCRWVDVNETGALLWLMLLLLLLLLLLRRHWVRFLPNRRRRQFLYALVGANVRAGRRRVGPGNRGPHGEPRLGRDAAGRGQPAG